MNTIDLKQLSEVEIKAFIYDHIQGMEFAKHNIGLGNKEIERRAKEVNTDATSEVTSSEPIKSVEEMEK